jgi:hypothetical protein
MLRTSVQTFVVITLAFAAGCAQVTGQVRGIPVVDLLPSTAMESSCSVTLLDHGAVEARAELVKLGTISVDGPVWLVRQDIEDHARHRACAAGASHAVITRERYGTLMLGSSAEVHLYGSRAAPSPHVL